MANNRNRRTPIRPTTQQGSRDCDPTTEVELWGVCYDIEETTELDLYNSGLTGEIPPEIGQLTNLTNLDLVGNQLTGEIPSEIGNLTNLTRLELYDNQLTGEIPVEIGNLTNLTRLTSNDNQLTGEIPSWIGNLTSLERLWLRNNQLTGEIPPEIGNLTNLNILWLDNNQLTGEIPEEICNIEDSSPSLTNNQLCPPYPECLSEWSIGEQDTSMCPCTEVDECGECLVYSGGGCNPSISGNTPYECCDCDGNTNDCAGVCGGNAVEDCSGVCGGDAEFDECGVCGGPGATVQCNDGGMACTIEECDIATGCTDVSTPHIELAAPWPLNFDEWADVFDGTCDFGISSTDVCDPFILYLVVDTTGSMGVSGINKANMILQYYESVGSSGGYPCGFGIIDIGGLSGYSTLCETNILSLDDALLITDVDSVNEFISMCNQYGNISTYNPHDEIYRTRGTMIPLMFNAYNHLMDDPIYSNQSECQDEDINKIITVITDDDGMVWHCGNINGHNAGNYEVGDGNICEFTGLDSAWPCSETDVQVFIQNLINDDIKVYFDLQGTSGSQGYPCNNGIFDYRSMVFHFGPDPNFVFTPVPTSTIEDCNPPCDDPDALNYNSPGECIYPCDDPEASNTGAAGTCIYNCPDYGMVSCMRHDADGTKDIIQCCGYSLVEDDTEFKWVWSGCSGPSCTTDLGFELGGEFIDTDGDGYFDEWVEDDGWNDAIGISSTLCTDAAALNCSCECNDCHGCPNTSDCGGNSMNCLGDNEGCTYPTDPCEENEGYLGDNVTGGQYWGLLGLMECRYPTDELHCAYSLDECCTEDMIPTKGCLDPRALNYKCMCVDGLPQRPPCLMIPDEHHDRCCLYNPNVGPVVPDEISPRSGRPPISGDTKQQLIDKIVRKQR